MSNIQITINAKNINVKKVDISNLNSRARDADVETTEQESESEVKHPVVSNDKKNKNFKDLKDHTGFSPKFMTIFEEEHVDFSKKRWTEVIREIIKSCSITKDDFIEKMAVLQKKELPKFDVNAVYGKVDGIFINPERNGWFYIPEFDISIRIKTANKMFEIVKTLVKGTDFEGNICLFLLHDYEKNLYRTVPI